MLAYNLGITKRGTKGIVNWGRFKGLQIGTREITNRGSLRVFKSGQKDYKSSPGFQIAAKRFQIRAREITDRAGISNRGRDYKSVQNRWLPKGIFDTKYSGTTLFLFALTKPL